jgi:serine/threonine protein phosphatase PrpC
LHPWARLTAARWWTGAYQELKPWILCDSTKRFSYVNVSVKGARNNNEDAIYSDGQLFAVYDGHGGKHASLLAQKELAEHFYKATGEVNYHDFVLPRSHGPPIVVDALDEAYAATQASIPTSHAKAQAGSTGVTCWVHPGALSQ